MATIPFTTAFSSPHRQYSTTVAQYSRIRQPIIMRQQQRSILPPVLRLSENPNIDMDESTLSSSDDDEFIATYPRFRVDLSRVPRVVQDYNDKQNEKDNNSDKPPIISLPLLPEQKDNVLTALWSWTTTSVSTPQVAQKLTQQFPAATVRVVEEEPSVFPTCHVMRQLWQAVQQQQQLQYQQSSSSPNDDLYLLVPNAFQGVTQNFAEILDWPNQQQQDQDSEDYFQDYPIASVEFIASSSNDPKSQPTSNHPITSITNGWDGCVVHITFRNQSQEHGNLDLDISSSYSDLVNRRTQAWVQRILVQAGICPFTKSPRKSGQGLKAQGVPVGWIAYHHAANCTVAARSQNENDKNDNNNTSNNKPLPLSQLLIPLLSDTWHAMYDMLQAGDRGSQGVSSILLAAPEFDHNFQYWAGPVFAMLEASVVAAQAESLLGVVCFHPKYAVSDGATWPGFGHMHSVPRLTEWVKQDYDNDDGTSLEQQQCPFSTQDIAAGGAWQRRTPHATINVLRANQLAAAEQVRSSANLYPRNIRVLMSSSPSSSDGTLALGGNEELSRALDQERNLGGGTDSSPFDDNNNL